MTPKEIAKKIIPILRSYGAKKASVFGSAARGEAKNGSDIDILVDIKKDISLLEFIKMKQLLEKKLGRKVDLVEYQTLKPALKDKILSEQVSILWKK